MKLIKQWITQNNLFKQHDHATVLSIKTLILILRQLHHTLHKYVLPILFFLYQLYFSYIAIPILFVLISALMFFLQEQLQPDEKTL